tara:strand:- start:5 stop:319 length:315 start_codon:yes stop_codon:yes gene_type:complete
MINKNILLIIVLTVFISSCQSIKKTLSGAKQKSSDEFLVKKKNPLIMPPNFDELPKPQITNTENKTEDKGINFSNVLKKSKTKKVIKKNDNSLEKSISKILNSN